MEKQQLFRALYDYDAKDDDELSFKASPAAGGRTPRSAPPENIKIN